VATTIAPTTTEPHFYKVQSGDTLGKIAARFGLPIQAIMEKNKITNPDKIFAGQILELPLASEIVVTSLPPVTTAPGPTALPAITNPGP
jgi:LysM repeat protein